MCEVGSWKTFEDIEDSLTLDDLYMLYDKTADRQKRMLETVAAALGAGPSVDKPKEPVMGPIALSDASGAVNLFGYSQGQGDD